MSILEHKILSADLLNKQVTDAADRPTGTAQQIKYLFDRLALEVVIPALNALIDELTNSGAASVGTSVSGVAGTDVQTVLESMKALIDDRYTKEQADGLLGDKADKTAIAPMLADMTIDENGVITVTRQNGTTKSWDTALEKIAINFDFDAATQKLMLTLEDGTTKEVDLSAFVKPNEFIDSATIDFTAGADGTVTATIRAGSVTDEMLDSAIKEALIAYRDAAAASAAAAAASENNALTYKQAAETARIGAEKAETEAAVSEINAEVYAEGGTLTGHEGEVILQEELPGAKGYMLLAQQYANNAATSASTADTRANAAAESERNAEASKSTAATAAQSASESASAAQASKTAAETAKAAAAVSESAAKTSETNAAASETAAAASARAAKTSEKNAKASQTAAEASQTAAKTSETNAAASAKRAEDAAAQAGEIVGGDFATKTELNAHAGDTTKHVTASERTAWNSKLDASQKGTAGGVATLGSDGKVPTAQLPNTGLMPELIVTVNAGSVITAVCGDQTVTATATDGTAVMALPGYGNWKISAIKGSKKSNTVLLSVDSVKQYAVALVYANIYGVEWDGTSTTALTRTDDAAGFTDPVPAVNNGTGSSPFDNLLPWSGMTRITDSVAGELVAIPKFWYKFTKSGNTLKLQIADGQVDGFFVSPAHADRGDGNGERDIVYVGRYHCASGYKSTTGVAQQTNITRSTARTNIHNLGATIWQFDYAMRLTIQMLYLVEFADWDSQTKIGYGCSARGSMVNNGQTDAMQYHTGTTEADRTTYGFTQYRYIEGLWDNVYDWMDGCYYNSSGMNIILNPSKFSDSANGTSIGTPPDGWISAFNVVESGGVQWLCPSGNSGSKITYIPDYWSFNASNPCLFCGGSYGKDLGRGLFYVFYYSASDTSKSLGCRLQKLP